MTSIAQPAHVQTNQYCRLENDLSCRLENDLSCRLENDLSCRLENDLYCLLDERPCGRDPTDPETRATLSAPGRWREVVERFSKI